MIISYSQLQLNAEPQKTGNDCFSFLINNERKLKQEILSNPRANNFVKARQIADWLAEGRANQKKNYLCNEKNATFSCLTNSSYEKRRRNRSRKKVFISDHSCEWIWDCSPAQDSTQQNFYLKTLKDFLLSYHHHHYHSFYYQYRKCYCTNPLLDPVKIKLKLPT